MRIVDRLVEDAKDLSARLQDPRSAYPTPGYEKGKDRSDGVEPRGRAHLEILQILLK